EMLLVAVVKRAHAFLHHRVFHLDAGNAREGFAALYHLAVLQPVVLAVAEHREILIDVDANTEARPRDLPLPLRGVDRLVVGVADEIEEGGVIVDRHESLHRAPALLAGEHTVERRDEMADANIGLLVGIDHCLADRRVAEAIERLLDIEARPRVVRWPLDLERAALVIRNRHPGRRLEGVRVKEVRMRGIDHALEALHPIAGDARFDDDAMRGGQLGELESERRRLQFRRAEIGPDDAPRLAQRISPRTHIGLELARLRLRRRVDDAPCHIELPAVIEAAQPAILGAAQNERRAAMRAELVQHADAALAVAEGNEGLAEKAHALRIAIGFELVAHQSGNPIAADHASHRRLRPDAAEQFVFLACQHRLTYRG